MRTNLTIAGLVLIIASCELPNQPADKNPKQGNVFVKELQKVYSPDQSIPFTITEYGLDTLNTTKQLMVNFKESGAGVYAVSGPQSGIEAFWLNNNTMLIVEDSSNNVGQKQDQVQSFDKIVQIDYQKR